MASLGPKSTLYVIAVGRGPMVSDYIFGRKADQVESAARKRSFERRQEIGSQPGPMPVIRYGKMYRMYLSEIPPEVLPMNGALACLQAGGVAVASMTDPMSPWQVSCSAA